jgi:hypothetical protein
VLSDRVDALIVPKADAIALARAVGEVIDNPVLAAGLSAASRKTGQRYDIAAFVQKMERLYELLHRTSRATRRAGILKADLSFLSTEKRVTAAEGAEGAE